MKQFHLHLVSDSTGETVSSVARSAIAQFDNIDPIEHVWSLVRTKGQVDKVLESIHENPGVVLYTLVEKSLRDQLRRGCIPLKIPCIPVIARVLNDMSAYLGIEVSAQPGRQHEMDEDYFSRMEAINFALTHDDGQSAWDLDEADIVLVGVSRTSKSPTCIYLANRGYRAANIPFVSECPLPENLHSLTRPLIVGLTVAPERLMLIRKQRLLSINEQEETRYVNREDIEREILESRRYFSRYGWPVIDVTRRSVEETAANIIQYYQERRGG